MNRLRVVVVSAGVSEPSSTRLLADRLGASVEQQLDSVAIETIDLREIAVDVARSMIAGFPVGEADHAVTAVTQADGLIVATPVFNASYSGLFKSFFDIVDKDAFAGKPVLIAATGGSPRHSMVLDHALRPMFSYLRAVVVPTGVYAASWQIGWTVRPETWWRCWEAHGGPHHRQMGMRQVSPTSRD
jgi:FMN reductase